jgi:multidrug efflux pump subunit AcrA (membrane-fusion protein)
MTDTTKPTPTERQPKETAPAYAAFRCYLELGPDRSLAKAGRALGKSKNLMEGWSTKWNWVERVAAFESAAARAVDEAQLDERAKRARRQAQIAASHAEAGAMVAGEIGRRIQKARADGLDPFKGMSLKTLFALEATLTRAHAQSVVTERLALGMTTDQPAEQTPYEKAQEVARKLTEDELNARLAGLDELAVHRAKREAAA